MVLGVVSLIYFWPAQAADDVLGLAAVDRDEGHLEADRTLQLLLLGCNLPLDGIQPLQVPLQLVWLCTLK